ncbi:MAG: DNA primase [Planctomycetota bacterium]|jgi:DNA primase
MAGFFDEATIIRIQQANDIGDVIGEHVNLVKKGKEMVGLCPFHQDHRPSMYVNEAKQIFKCFACGAGGDVLKFVQMRENLTFPQAVERLAQRAGVQLPKKTNKPGHRKSQTEEQKSIDPNKLAKINVWASKHFQENLHDKQKGKHVRAYLAKRQIDKESIEKWRLGLANSNNDLLAKARGQNVPIDLLVKAGLVTNQIQDKFVNRLMFPITDVTGRIIGFGGRTLDDAEAKYVNSPATPLFDKSNCLYGLEQARHEIVKTGQAVVVEGYTDCIMAHSKGCCNVVATLGTSFTAGHGGILRRYAKSIILLFDSDTAGAEAANRALEVCLSQHMDIKLASVPEGKDPCEYVLAAGKEGFEEVINSAVDAFRFKWDRLIEKFDKDDTLAGKRAAIEEFLQTIATCLHSGYITTIDRGLVVNRLSKVIGLDSKEINAELTKRLTRVARAADYDTRNQKVQNTDLGQGLFASAGREVLEVLLNEPRLFESVKNNITPDDFDAAMLRQIAAIVFEILYEDANISLSEVLVKIESVEIGSTVVELAQAGEKKGNFQSRLVGAVATLQRYRGRKKNLEIKEIDDQTQFLRQACEDAAKQNPHNLGMI